MQYYYYFVITRNAPLHYDVPNNAVFNNTTKNNKNGVKNVTFTT